MEKYLTHDNMGRPFLVTVDRNTKIVYIYCEIPGSKEEVYDDTPILIYNYDDIFIGDHIDNIVEWGTESKGNNILIGLGHNIYIHVGCGITVFKSLAKIINYFSPIGNNDVPYPYFIDELSNVYCQSSGIIIKEYYLDNKKNINEIFCGYWINDINESFQYKHHFYDINGKFVAFNKKKPNNTNFYNITYSANPEKEWIMNIKGRKIHSYQDSKNNTHVLTKEFYCK